MIVSYVAQITIISLLVNILTQNEKQLWSLGIFLLAAVIFVIVLTRTKYVYSRFNRIVEKILSRRLVKQRKKSIDKILKVSPGFGVFEFVLDDGNPYCDMSLNNAQLSHLQIHVLKVERGAKTIDFPDAEFVLQQGDKLVLYGKTDSVTQIALGNLDSE
jgi:Trk K+ transport system NAD-binding subunit